MRGQRRVCGWHSNSPACFKRVAHNRWRGERDEVYHWMEVICFKKLPAVEPDGRKHNTYVDDRISCAYIRCWEKYLWFLKNISIFFFLFLIWVSMSNLFLFRSMKIKLYEFNFWEIYISFSLMYVLKYMFKNNFYKYIKSTETNKIMVSVFLLFWNKVSSSWTN